jgi:hypothetical protein
VSSFVCRPATICAPHAAIPSQDFDYDIGRIYVSLDGTGTAWSGAPISFASAPAGCSLVYQYLAGPDQIILTIAVGSATGTIVLADGVTSTSLPVQTAAMTVDSPDWLPLNATTDVHLRGINTVWDSEGPNAYHLSISGVPGCSLVQPVPYDPAGADPDLFNHSRLLTITTGSSTGTLVITDNASGATTTIQVGEPYALPFTPPVDLVARTEYRYLTYSARTGAYLDELPLSGLRYTERLNDIGELSANLDLSARTASGRSLADAYVSASAPRRTRLFVERDGVLVWSGIIWRRRRALGSDGVVQLQALDDFSYFARRKLTVSRSYTGVDQLAVARDLISWAQSQPAGDVRIELRSETSGVLLTRTPIAWGYEYRNIADLLTELAAADNGFDFAFRPAYDSLGHPTVTLELYYPRRGRTATSSNLVFFNASNSGGNLIDWDLDESGLDSATSVYGIGAGEGESMVQAVATRTELLDAGYPMTEAVASYKTITDGATLVGLTIADVAGRSADQRTWSIVVDPDDISVPFGTWTVGDDARVVIDDDPLFPSNGSQPGLETTLRIIEQSVSVSDDGGPDDVTLTLGAARG